MKLEREMGVIRRLLSMFGVQRLPLAVAIVFGIFSAAGTTMATAGAYQLVAMVRMHALLLPWAAFAMGKVLLGLTTFIYALRLLGRSASCRRPLMWLAVAHVAVDVVYMFERGFQPESVVEIAFIFIGIAFFLVAVWLLNSRRLALYLTKT